MSKMTKLLFPFLLVCQVLSLGGVTPEHLDPNLNRIDAHFHIFSSAPVFYEMLNRLRMRVLNICVVDKYDRGFEEAEPQLAKALEIFKASHGRVAWCSTFDPQNWESPGFAERAIVQLDKSFKEGAVAVKIYKNIGMELKSASGKYLMPDDPVFDPILRMIESRGKTLFAHIAEPSAAWKALDPSSPHYSYYKENPDWHMYLHPERPSKETILAARDHLLRLHPKLRVVGCHLGSMEDDVNEIAKRFESYPNFAVDTAARVPDLMYQSHDKVRSFLIKYQDRVLYATDGGIQPKDKAEESVKKIEATYVRDWKFFATDEALEHGGRKIRGLALPKPVLDKIFRDNALHWVPGIVGKE